MTKITLFVLALIWGYVSAVGSFAYSDSTGREYTGTYGDNEAPPNLRSAPFNDISGYGFPFYQEEFPDFGTTYFSHLERFLQEAFAKNIENQNRAFLAAKKAFDLTARQAFPPTFPNRFQPMFPQPPGFGHPMFGINNRMNPLANDAFASSAIGPGYRQQIAAINPSNPAMPNVFENVKRFSSQPKRNNFYSVSSSSFSTSANVGGKLVKHRGSETLVNDNGMVTKYAVNN